MEKKNILIYSGIVILGLGLMVGFILFLRNRNAPPPDNLTLVEPAAQPTASKQSLPPPPVQNVGVRKFQPLDQVPQAKSSGTNVKSLR